MGKGESRGGGLRPSAPKPTPSGKPVFLGREDGSCGLRQPLSLGLKAPEWHLACGFHGQPAGEGLVALGSLLGRAVRVGRVGRAVFWAHVCVEAH